MDTAATPDPTPQATGGGAFLTADLFLKAMKENRDDIIGSFNATIGTLSKRIEDNSALIAANASAIRAQSDASTSQKLDIDRLTERVLRLENGSVAKPHAAEKRAILSPDYTRARRSIRIWPIVGDCEEALWEGVGDFLHVTLAIRTDDLGQGDIEAVSRVRNPGVGADNFEALVTFFDKAKRDLVVTHSPSLAGKFDGNGLPTAGIRLEIPPELNDTFRLLSRFGARLRARHGAGTKRHIKFDDFSATLYVNVKLPGDSSWTKVTPAMARADLDASMKEEGLAIQKRLATKLMPGPRERLSRPMPAGTLARLPPAPAAASDPVAGPSGKRPRWSVPDRRQKP